MLCYHWVVDHCAHHFCPQGTVGETRNMEHISGPSAPITHMHYWYSTLLDCMCYFYPEDFSAVSHHHSELWPAVWTRVWFDNRDNWWPHLCIAAAYSQYFIAQRVEKLKSPVVVSLVILHHGLTHRHADCPRELVLLIVSWFPVRVQKKIGAILRTRFFFFLKKKVWNTVRLDY